LFDIVVVIITKFGLRTTTARTRLYPCGLWKLGLLFRNLATSNTIVHLGTLFHNRSVCAHCGSTYDGVSFRISYIGVEWMLVIEFLLGKGCLSDLLCPS